MIDLKTPLQIQTMMQGGERLRNVSGTLKKEIREGMATEDIDKRARYLLRSHGGESSFTKVKGYRWSTCLPINEQVVHTPPSKRRLKKGDVLTLDIGMFYDGYHTDYADTFVIGESNDPMTDKFLEVGKNCLSRAIKVLKKGNRIGHVSSVIQETILRNGYFVLRDLTGHGIGRELHEDPFVPGYLSGPISSTPEIRAGLVVAIEVIYSMGTEKIAYEPGDGWSIATIDGSLSACFEHTVAVTEKGPVLLT